MAQALNIFLNTFYLKYNKIQQNYMGKTSIITLEQIQQVQEYINSRIEYLEKLIDNEEKAIPKINEKFNEIREKPHLLNDIYLKYINKYANDVTILHQFNKFKNHVCLNPVQNQNVDYYGNRLNILISDLEQCNAITDILALFKVLILK